MRSWWHRFKRWQKAPLSYELTSTQMSHCVNCGHEFIGNYCPYCSQKRGMGRITWNAVREDMMKVWGLHSRSLLYSLWQLIFRPGYFISDYINGKRQVSYPPVKMLILVSLVSLLIDKLNNNVRATVVEVASTRPEDVSFSYAVNDFLRWFNANPGWGWLLINSFLLIPTWLMFRHSPRNAKHTLPQGFFVLVFLSTEVLVYDCLSDCISGVFSLLMPLCYLFTYKQLFGYRWWGTFWRANMAVLCGLFIVLLFASLYFFHLTPQNIEENTVTVVVIFFSNVLILGVGVLFDSLGHRLREKRERKKSAEKKNVKLKESAISDYKRTIEHELPKSIANE